MRRGKTIIELLKYLKRLKYPMVVNCLICVMYEIFPVANVFMVSYLIGACLGKIAIDYTLILVLLMISTVLHSIFGYLNMWTEHDIAYKLIYQMRYEIYCRLEKATPTFDDDLTSSKLASIVSNDMNLIEWFYAHTVNIFVTCIAMFIGINIFYFNIHPLFAVNVSIWLIFYLMCPLFFNKLSKEQGKKVRENYGTLSEVVVDGIQGMKEIMNFNLFKMYTNRLDEAMVNYESVKREDAKRRASEWVYTIVIVALMNISTMLIIGLLYTQGKLNTEWITVLLAVGSSVFVVYSKFMSMSTQFSNVFAASERVLKLLRLPIRIIDSGEKELTEEIETIEFKNVVYSYPNSKFNQIDNMSFKIDKGMKVALSGESGSGKSTIVYLLERYIEPISGEILINDENIKNYTLKSLRNALAVVKQDTYLFNGTIAENIKMGKPEASREEIVWAAKIAQAHEFITDLSKGYDTDVGVRALKLSGGQRQRISIARAILKGGSVLVFDEAQSGLDYENEKELNESIHNALTDKILILIAHRLSSISKTDKVLFIDHGRLIAMDSFINLKNDNELFREKVIGIN